MHFLVATPKEQKMPNLTMTRVSTKTMRPGVAPKWQSLSVPTSHKKIAGESEKEYKKEAANFQLTKER